MPDIDLDFARDIREALILRVHNEFGPDHAPLVGEIISYKMRSAVRDVGKALGLPEAELDKLAKRVEARHAYSPAGGDGVAAGVPSQGGRPALARPREAGGGDRRHAASPVAARGRDDHLVEAGRGAGAHREGRHARTLRLPVGQGLRRRRRHDQDRLPGAGDAVAGRGVRGAYRRAPRPLRRPQPHRFQRRRRLRHDLRRRYHRRLPDREPRPDAAPAADAAALAGGPDAGGGDCPAGAHRRQGGEPVRAAQAGQGAGHLRPPVAGGGAERHAGCRHLPGPGLAGGDGAGGLHRRTGGGAASGDKPQAVAGGDAGLPAAVPGGRAGPRRRRGDGADGVRQAAGLRGVRLPQEPLRRLRRARLPVVVAEEVLPGRVLLRPLQRPADGLLRAARLHERRRSDTAWAS